MTEIGIHVLENMCSDFGYLIIRFMIEICQEWTFLEISIPKKKKNSKKTRHNFFPNIDTFPSFNKNM